MADDFGFADWLAQYETPEQIAAMGGPVVQAPTASYQASGGDDAYLGANGLIQKSNNIVRSRSAGNSADIAALKAAGGTTSSSNKAAIDRMQQLIDQQAATDANYIQQSNGLVDQIGQRSNTANQFDWNALAGYQSDLAGLDQQTQGYLGTLGSSYQSLSPQLQSTLQANMLTSQAAQAYADPNSIAAQNAALGFLQGGMNGSLDYQSQAAQAYADPAAVAAQWDALASMQDASRGSLDISAGTAKASQQAMQEQWNAQQRLKEIGNGSLNYTSDAQYAAPDAEDLNNQRTAAAQLQGAAYGANDVNFWGLPGIFDIQGAAAGRLNVDINDLEGGRALYDIYSGKKDLSLDSIQGLNDLKAAYGGSQDVHVGQEDPEAYAAMQEALAKYKGLTDPKVTAAEDYIYKQAQERQDLEERGTREAVLTNLRQRGLSGSGQELTSAALGASQASRNRTMADLGAQAQAVQRSMDALQGYAGLSSAMSGQANDLASRNATNRLAALGQYTGISSDVAQGNVNRQVGAMQQYAGLQSGLEEGNRNRQLQAQQYFTGLGADVETSNQNRRLNAQQAASDAYATLREQGFSEDFARRQAKDVEQQFNADLQFRGSGAASDAAATLRGQEFNESAWNVQNVENVGNANNNRRLTALGMSGDEANSIRNSSFDEAYKRGIGADNASANNQQTRLSSGIASGNLASNMRNSSFNEAFSRGSAADQTNQFNELNRKDVQKYNQDFAQSERDSAWNRTTDYATLGLRGTEDLAQNKDRSYTAGRLTNETTTNRDLGTIAARDTVLGREQTASNNLTDRNLGVQGTLIGNNNQDFGQKATLTQLGISDRNASTAGELAINDQRLGQIYGDEAAAAARKAAKDQEKWNWIGLGKGILKPFG